MEGKTQSIIIRTENVQYTVVRVLELTQTMLLCNYYVSSIDNGECSKKCRKNSEKIENGTYTLHR